MSRLTNSYATHSSTPLCPLRNRQNEDVVNFPYNGAAIDALNGQLQGLPALLLDGY